MSAVRRHRAFIGLGGNLSGPLGGPVDYLAEALGRLESTPAIHGLRRSRLYRSAPWGKTDQDDFINAVAEIETTLEPEQLLERLLAVEKELGRRRGEKWGPRLIDLDLLSFDDIKLESERLLLPHPRMHERVFVLAPLLELDPDFHIPGRGRAERFLAEIGDRQRAIPL